MHHSEVVQIKNCSAKSTLPEYVYIAAPRPPYLANFAPAPHKSYKEASNPQVARCSRSTACSQIGWPGSLPAPNWRPPDLGSSSWSSVMLGSLLAHHTSNLFQLCSKKVHCVLGTVYPAPCQVSCTSLLQQKKVTEVRHNRAPILSHGTLG